MTNTNQVCNRCSGKGMFVNLIHREGGECFACLGTGRKLAAFDKAFFKAKGSKFFGISSTYNGKTLKEIVKAVSIASVEADLIDNATAKEITEDQARAFFAKYGTSVEV